MCVEDRVMGETTRQRYNPAKDIDANGEVVVKDAQLFPPGIARTVAANNRSPSGRVLLKNFDQDIAMEVMRNIESAALEDEVEWQRLQLALKRFIAGRFRPGVVVNGNIE